VEYELIHAYTRTQAINDGSLIPIPAERLKEYGVCYPLALTINLWAELNPSASEAALGQSFDGRLHDLLTLFRYHAKLCEGDRLVFKMTVLREWIEDEITVKSVVGPDDDLKPCITLMLPGDD